MSLADDILTAKRAVDKLNRYSDGMKACGGKDATSKYLQLNSQACRAINRLPDGFMRTRQGLDLAAKLVKIKQKIDSKSKSR